MNWTDKDTEELLTLKNNMDSDDIRIKEKIKEVLLNNRFIIHTLNNKDLEANVEEDGTGTDEYFGVNIIPHYIINPTQYQAETFICYEVGYSNLERYSRVSASYKELAITFQILSNYKVLIDQQTGIARHDLLAALITDQFNYSNYFGQTIYIVADQPSIVDNDFACRTLTFRQTSDNSLVKTINGQQQLANKIKGEHFVG